jgi:hypothetical protein
MQRLDTLKFALAGAIYGGTCIALVTISALLGIPGFRPFTDLLAQFYGFYGYSVSALSGSSQELFGDSLKDLFISASSLGSTICC